MPLVVPFLDDVSWGSHLPALLTCVAATEGPVLELGVGYYSTPLLHAVCCPGRYLVSVEHDAEFLRGFAGFAVDGHDVRLSPGYSCLEGLSQWRWSVVLVDNSPAARRTEDAMLFQDMAEFIVIHDYCNADVRVPLEPFLERFRHRYVATRYTPHTIVLSRNRPIPSIP